MNSSRHPISKANASDFLKIKAYKNCENCQNTHPSVIYLKDGWNGYKFWMGVTPYQGEDENLENPCILASNDGIEWTEPKKGLNPLVKTLSKHLYHFSDPQLVAVNNRLEIWYRKRVRMLGRKTQEVIMRKVSSDGIKWTGKEVLALKENNSAANMLSPCVIYEDGKYKIWVSDFENKKIVYYESDTGMEWRKIRDITIRPYDNDKYVWHMDIKRTGKGYEMYYCAGSSYLCREMCYAWSRDNITWSSPVCVMKGSEDNFDEFLYRPSFADLEDKSRLVYYGAQRRSDAGSEWYIGLSLASKDAPACLTGLQEIRIGSKHDEQQER